MVEVAAVTPLEGHWLRLTLSDGDVVERDVQDLLTGGVLEPVRERREIFEAALSMAVLSRGPVASTSLRRR